MADQVNRHPAPDGALSNGVPDRMDTDNYEYSVLPDNAPSAGPTAESPAQPNNLTAENPLADSTVEDTGPPQHNPSAGLPNPTAEPPAASASLPPRIPTPAQPTLQIPSPVHKAPAVTSATSENPFPLPSKAAAHGAPARQYLNEKVTGVVLEGMKWLACDRPDAPLRYLGEYLLARSRELEGTTNGHATDDSPNTGAA